MSKSLPRIGRRSDLETFPLISSPSSDGQRGEINWPGRDLDESSRQNLIRSQYILGRDRGGGERESFVIPFLDEDHVAPTGLQVDQYTWTKLIGDNPSETVRNNLPPSSLLDESTRNLLYRTRTRK
jgi:hypothetical protein